MLSELDKYAIDFNQFDLEIYSDMKEKSDKLEDKEKEGLKLDDEYPFLQTDVFNSLRKPNPQPNMMSQNRIHEEVMERLMAEQDFIEMHYTTRGDEVMASLGTLEISNQVFRFLENHQDEIEKQKKIDEQKEKVEQMEAQEQPEKKIEKAKKKFKKMVEDLKEDIEDFGKELSEAMARACKDAKEIVQAASEFEQVLGCGEGNELGQKPSADERLKMAEEIKNGSVDFRKIVDMMGRMERLANSKQETKSTHGFDEIHAIKRGDNLKRLLKRELVKLRHPVLRRAFLQDYLKKNLLEYEMRGKEKESKGPIIVAVDISYSMAGEKEMMAKAFACALAMIAIKQNRSFTILFFNSSIAGEITVEGKGNHIRKKIKDIATFPFGGGTDFDPVLKRSLKLIETSEFEKGDVLWLTDGEANTSEALVRKYNKAKKEKGFVHYSIMVPPAVENVLRKFSDDVFKTNDLLNDGMAIGGRIFSAV